MDQVAVAVIPARYGSTRFPGKPLAMVAGKPLIQRVWERAGQAGSISRVIVATDDNRIREAVEGFGGEAMMTRSDHPSGSDRLGEVAEAVQADVIVNVQGDEPLIDPAVIDRVVAPFSSNDAPDIVTAATAITSDGEYRSPDVVKVVVDGSGYALYFSRSPVPHSIDAGGWPEALRHIGIYAYDRRALLRFVSLPQGRLERVESLEQLRALENGMRIKVVNVAGHAGIGVDRPEDIKRVEKKLEEEH